jgi:hypothetical protein
MVMIVFASAQVYCTYEHTQDEAMDAIMILLL